MTGSSRQKKGRTESLEVAPVQPDQIGSVPGSVPGTAAPHNSLCQTWTFFGHLRFCGTPSPLSNPLKQSLIAYIPFQRFVNFLLTITSKKRLHPVVSLYILLNAGTVFEYKEGFI